MFGIGVPELILILVVGLIVFGPGKLPEMGRSLGKGIREFRKASNALTAAIRHPHRRLLHLRRNPLPSLHRRYRQRRKHLPQHRHPRQRRPQLPQRRQSRRIRRSRKRLPQRSRHSRNV